MTDTTTAAPAAGRSEAVALSVRGLKVATASGTQILHGIDFDVRPGQLLGLVGESGSGKTTAGLACLGHFRTGLRHAGGTVTLSDVEMLSLGSEGVRGMRGSRISYVPQDPALSLNPAMRIGDQIMEILQVHGWGASTAERRDRTAEVLSEVDLPATEAYRRRYPHELSGGQQQRVGIAMAFACRPEVMVLDEPTTGLDVSTQALVLETIHQMTQRHGVAGIYISHDLAVVAEVADEVAVMLQGEIVESGAIGSVLQDPQHPYTRRLLRSVPDLDGLRQVGEVESVSPAGREASRDTQGDTAVLQVSDLAVRYGDHRVLDGVDLTLREGQTLMLLGESGSGKTTLSRCIAGLNPHYQGEVALRGSALAASTRRRSTAERQDIQYVFQSPFSSLNPRRTIGESVEIPMLMSGKLGARERRRVAEETLERVRLDASYYHRRPRDLSGGERQRAAIARALVNTPSVMVCDEVTSALDVSVQSSILDLLRELQTETGMAMLFVTHNITLARHISHQLAVLQQGRLVEYAPTDEVLGAPTHEYTKSLLSNIATL